MYSRQKLKIQKRQVAIMKMRFLMKMMKEIMQEKVEEKVEENE